MWAMLDGGIYFTDPYYPRPYWKRGPKEIKIEGVYYLGPGCRKLVRVVEDQKQPNGMIGTPDGKILELRGRLGDGKTSATRSSPTVNYPTRNSSARWAPTGMTIDDEGNVYLTGQGVTVFDKQGKKIEHIATPRAVDGQCLFRRQRTCRPCSSPPQKAFTPFARESAAPGVNDRKASLPIVFPQHRITIRLGCRLRPGQESAAGRGAEARIPLVARLRRRPGWAEICRCRARV